MEIKNRRTKQNKKSQTTLEFLTTYLWVFAVILVLAGVLAYFGVFNPRKGLPQRCTMSPEIECVTARIGKTDAGTGVLRLRLRNDLNEPIIVASWDTSSESKTPFSCTLKPTIGIWLSGEVRDSEFTNCNNDAAGIVQGESAKVNVKMTYYLAKSSAAFSKDIEGEILATVTNVESLLTRPECSDDIDNDKNGCIDYAGGDTGCSNPSDTLESGGICPQNGGAGLSLYCFVSTVCFTSIIFRMSNLKDAHAEVPSSSNYDYNVCCRADNDVISNSCSSPEAVPLHLSASTDAHVEKNTQSNYNVNVCLSAATGTVSCGYSASDCLPTETCLATISADTDAHVADCVTQPFANKICCKIS